MIGTIRQTIRKGCWSGRRALGLHQLLLVFVFIFTFINQSELHRRASDINLMLESEEPLPELYTSFEVKLDEYFNPLYYNTICNTEYEKDALIPKLIANMCPEAAPAAPTASLEDDSKTICDLQNKCQSQRLTKTCPFHLCRRGILLQIEIVISRIARTVYFLGILSGIMIIFTCLLICYNPSDSIEVELMKAGLLLEEDVETIRNLKKENKKKFSFEKGTRNTLNLEEIRKENKDVRKRKKPRVHAETP
ncbi:hypothetical protein CTEN210_04826 [Chaetoceros tenuissimus]|uniref:Uncharacterized protein n=1 Tax=Chaetoceros tenuissimus TaxID=426638 RepID=A0AAD3H2V6_9STRA|nr:hypothetical protein CTEN210_04826 [Chaetoceros tenuissimus]